MSDCLLFAQSTSSVDKVNSSKLDSLKNTFASQGHRIPPNELAALCRLIAVEYTQDEVHDSALVWIQKAALIATDSLDKSRYNRGVAVVLSYLERMQEVPAAVADAARWLPLPDSMELFAHENLLGNAYCYTGRYTESFVCRYNCLRIGPALDNHEAMYVSTMNMGIIYYKVKDYETAGTYWRRARRLAKKPLDLFGDERFLHFTNLALAMVRTGQSDSAKLLMRRFLSAKRSKLAALSAEYALGNAFYSLGRLDSARYSFFRSSRLSREINNRRFVAENLCSLGLIMVDQDQGDTARYYLQLAEKIASTENFEDVLLRIFEYRYRLESTTGTLASKLSYQNKLIAKGDQIFRLRMSAVIGTALAYDLEREYGATLKLNGEIDAANRESQDTASKLSYFQWTLIFALAALLVVLVRAGNEDGKQMRRLKATIRIRENLLTTRIEVGSSINAMNRHCIEDCKKLLTSSLFPLYGHVHHS